MPLPFEETPCRLRMIGSAKSTRESGQENEKDSVWRPYLLATSQPPRYSAR
jgi:hypothetical protein